MRKFIPIALVVGAVLTGPMAALAQDRGDEGQAKVETAQAATPKPAIAEKIEPSKLINVQIEITLTDQLGTATPTKKIVSMITTDGTPGRIRSGADAAQPEPDSHDEQRQAAHRVASGGPGERPEDRRRGQGDDPQVAVVSSCLLSHMETMRGQD
jgi:hypothetical protein